ncbi:MAG: hypothetical protein IJ819_00175 [Clostridiales bacterium]|nr:hypothetical protein [Clostridiales bacterium]
MNKRSKRSLRKSHIQPPFDMFAARARVKKAKKEQTKAFAGFLRGGNK